jgi:type IV pilus assembly protein PilN
MKNPFVNLFKKKPKGDENAPIPHSQDKKKKKDFLVNFLKID